MITFIKRIITSLPFRLLFTAGCVYLLSKKISFNDIVGQISLIPWWTVPLLVIYSQVVGVLAGVRWSWLLWGKIDRKRLWLIWKASNLAGFYGMFLPGSLSGDVTKWLILHKSFPELKKSQLAMSMVADRLVGLVSLVTVAFIGIVLAKVVGLNLPGNIVFICLGLFVGMWVAIGLAYLLDLKKYALKIKWLQKIVTIEEVVNKEGFKRVMQAYFISVFAQLVWIMPNYFLAVILKANMSLASIYAIFPIISFILVLPISLSGWGARELLYGYFFSQVGVDPHKAVLVSGVGGVIGLLSQLVGLPLLLIK